MRKLREENLYECERCCFGHFGMGKILAYIITACEEQHHGPFELFLLVLLFSPSPFNLFSLVKKISISVFIMFSDACEREKKIKRLYL